MQVVSAQGYAALPSDNSAFSGRLDGRSRWTKTQETVPESQGLIAKGCSIFQCLLISACLKICQTQTQATSCLRYMYGMHSIPARCHDIHLGDFPITASVPQIVISYQNKASAVTCKGCIAIGICTRMRLTVETFQLLLTPLNSTRRASSTRPLLAVVHSL